MKKILLLSFALLVGAINEIMAADMPQTSTSTNPVYYFISFARQPKKCFQDNSTTGVAAALSQESKPSIVTAACDLQMWRVETTMTPNVYRLVSKNGNTIYWNSGKSAYYSNAKGLENDSIITFVVSTNATYSGQWELQRSGATTTFNDLNGSGTSVGEYTKADGGAPVIFTQASNKNFLQVAVSDANVLLSSAVVGTALGQYPTQAIVDEYSAAVALATTVLNNVSATDSEFITALTNLSKATSVFNANKLSGVSNGDFSNGTTSWTVTAGTVTVADKSLSATTTKSALLAATTAKLTQSVSGLGNEFSLDFYFAAPQPSSTTVRSMNVLLFAGVGSTQFNFKVENGFVYLYGGLPLAWNKIGTTAFMTEYSTVGTNGTLADADAVLKPYRIKIDFHDHTLSSANYDVYVSAANSSTLTLLTSGQQYFQTAKGSNVTDVQFAAATANMKSYLITDVKLTKTQKITFPAIESKFTNSSDFELSAMSSSGLPVVFTSSNPAVATVTGSTVHIVGPGDTDITASCAGTVSIQPAADVVQKLTVSTITTTITPASEIRVIATNRRINVVGTAEVPKVYTVAGAEVLPAAELVPGVYIVKLAAKQFKICVQ